MAIEVYDQVFPFVNGGVLSDATEVSTEIKGSTQEVSTLLKDLAGFTPGPKMREVSIDNAVAISGDIYQIETYFLDNTIVTLKLMNGGSGKMYEGKGFFTSAKVSSGVGKTTTFSFTWVGEAKAFA